MQPNKTKIALVIGALMLGVSGTSNAAQTGTFDITITTVADVIITPLTPLDFGANIFTTAGSVCKMNAEKPAEADMNISTSAANAAADEYGSLTLSGCINGTSNATPGVYEISGAGGSNVTIKLEPMSSPVFSFTPDSNAISDYGNATPAKDDDSLAHLAPSVGKTLRLPTADDGTGSTNGTVEKNKMLLTVGGTLTIGATDLNPSTAYDDVFKINVVY